MAIITIQGERGPEKWNIRAKSAGTTPIRFSVAELQRFPENRSFMALTGLRDGYVLISVIDPSAVMGPGTRGRVDYQVRHSGGSAGGSMNIISRVRSGDRTWDSVRFRIPGYIEPMRGTGTSVTKVEAGAAWFENPMVWVGAAAAVGIALFMAQRGGALGALRDDWGETVDIVGFEVDRASKATNSHDRKRFCMVGSEILTDLAMMSSRDVKTRRDTRMVNKFFWAQSKQLMKACAR